MQGLLDTIGDVVVALDNSWRYTYFNAKAEALFGKKACDVLGKTMWEAFPERIPSGQVHPKLLEARETNTVQVFDHYLAMNDLWHQTHVYPHADGLTILTIDITKRKRLEAAHSLHDRELETDRKEAARRHLEAAVRSKDRFIAQVSHELRTPLTPVMINLSLLEELIEEEAGAALSRDAVTLIGIIRRNLQHEIRLIDDLLDVTRISNGKLSLKQQTVELHILLANAITLTKHIAESKDLRINLALLANDDKLWADETRIQQVFWNLLHNALKFAPHSSTIRIRTTTRAGYVIVTIQDEGIGIDPKNLPSIFEPFEQTDTNVTQKFGGLGLGLAITRNLVHLHGGFITAHSDGIGKGATFRVQLPLQTAGTESTERPSIPFRDVVGYSTEDRIPHLQHHAERS
ncbi:MAG TPA: PAS domain-containing sensor histidine kinase [Candidatus Kapabacteria bacterium]|jgi:PAS domain S-box-containing protein|nr:PAS domain-containing sensor histidine kinase [Candidatus Kapabacteria bacterium]